jgi:hypothetical protein
MTSPSIPGLGAISMLASGSPFGSAGRSGSSLRLANDLAIRQERFPANSFQLVDSFRLPSGCRSGPGDGCIRSFGGVCALLFGLGGIRLSRS